MSSSSFYAAGRIWDLYVMHSILTGWWLSRINTYNSSLFCAWIVFLCDLVYIMDALARASKNSNGFLISPRFFSFTISVHVSWGFVANIASAWKFITFIPLHVLVLLELDFSGLYLIVCVSRLARMLQTGRIHRHLTWTIMKLSQRLKRGPSMAKSSSPSKARKRDGLKTERRNSPFLEYIQRLQTMEIRHGDPKVF